MANINSATKFAKSDFPIFEANSNLVYLDSAATSQKPASVIERLSKFYANENASVGRGTHRLGANAEILVEEVRAQVAAYFEASNYDTIFTPSATYSLNLAAHLAAQLVPTLGVGDNILLSVAEHHANILPWQALAARTGASLVYLDVDEFGQIVDGGEIDDRTKILALTALSNVTGVVTDLTSDRSLVKKAREVGAITVVDICQAAPHIPLSLDEIDADFYALSAHKLYGPNGVGVLFGRSSLLHDQRFDLQPLIGGGAIVTKVNKQSSGFLPSPARFEPGTGPYPEIVAFGAALKFIDEIGGMSKIAEHELELSRYAWARIGELDFVKTLVTAPAPDAKHVPHLLSFNVDGVHPHDVGQILDEDDIAIRVGHHCAQLIHQRFGVDSSCRVSFGLYNDKNDVNKLIKSLKKVKEFFG